MSDAIVLAQALRLLEREARLQAGADRHTSARELTSYCAGELTPQHDLRLQWHLALCSECVDRLLDLKRFLEPVEAEGLDEIASWQDLRARLAKEPRVRRPPPGPWSMALAAALIPALAGLGLWNISLRQELLSPEPNPPIETIEMPGTLRAAPEPAEIRLPGKGRFVLSLTPVQVHDAEARLEIYEASGEWITTVPGLLRSESDTFDVGLARKLLPNGEYRLLLIGARDREETTLRILDL